jgi:hypothetical protein
MLWRFMLCHAQALQWQAHGAAADASSKVGSRKRGDNAHTDLVRLPARSAAAAALLFVYSDWYVLCIGCDSPVLAAHLHAAQAVSKMANPALESHTALEHLHGRCVRLLLLLLLLLLLSV